ncbi:hypothetical protein [Bilophila wadsworthia]
MSELGNFLYGQIVVRPIFKQFFGRSFFTVKELHDGRVGAVHAGAVLQLIYGIATSIDAKASFVPVICGEGKRLFCPCRFLLVCLLFFQLRLWRDGNGLFLLNLCSGGRDTFLPHVVLNVFFPYFLDLVRHEVEEQQLAGIVRLLAPSGHVFPSLSERREGGAMLAALLPPAGMFIRGEFQFFSVFNENPPVFFKKDNLVSRLHIESFANFSGNRDLALGRELGEFHILPPWVVLLVMYSLKVRLRQREEAVKRLHQGHASVSTGRPKAPVLWWRFSKMTTALGKGAEEPAPSKRIRPRR